MTSQQTQALSKPNVNPANQEIDNSRAGHPLSRVVGLLREYAVFVCSIMLFVGLAVASPPFLSQSNLLNVLSQQSYILIMAAAGTILLISGGIDISIGAVFALSGVVAAEVANRVGTPAGIIAGVAVGAGVGLINGLLTTVGRINALIATLATSFAVAGLAVIVSQGGVILVNASGWRILGDSGIGLVHYSVFVMIGFALLMWFILNRTVIGRQIFATGGNEEASWLSGIRTNRVHLFTYMLSGLSAGLGGVIVTSQVGVGQADAGSSVLFTVIAGIVVGGTSISGGQGSVARTCVGVLLIAMVNNGFTLLSFNPLYQQIVLGCIILLAVGADAWTKRRT